MNSFQNKLAKKRWWIGFCFFSVLGLLPLVSPTTLSAQEIIVRNQLTFPPTESSINSQILTISPGSAEAAIFDIEGKPNRRIAIKIEPSKKTTMMNEESNGKIKLYDFTFSGVLKSKGNKAEARLDSNGRLNNLRLGATAEIPSNADSGYYQRILKIEVEYD